VLGTPPAFVLSQDQTLREELPQRVVRSTTRASDAANRPAPETGQIPGPSLVGSDPCAHRRCLIPTDGACRPVIKQAAGLRPEIVEPSVHSGLRAQDGVNLGTVVLNGSDQEPTRATASNLDTLLDRGVGRRVRMLLSFQRPSHPFKKVIPPQTAHPGPNRVPERTDHYSAQIHPAARRGGPVPGVSSAGS
jgi:hypothetical protein